MTRVAEGLSGVPSGESMLAAFKAKERIVTIRSLRQIYRPSDYQQYFAKSID
jgi:hypothetical protein